MNNAISSSKGRESLHLRTPKRRGALFQPAYRTSRRQPGPHPVRYPTRWASRALRGRIPPGRNGRPPGHRRRRVHRVSSEETDLRRVHDRRDLHETRRRCRHPGALVRGCGQAYALQTVEPVTYRCGTRRVCQARSSGSERDTRARPHAVAPMNCVPEDSRRRSTWTGRTHSPRARADGHQTPASTVAVRAPSPS